MTCSTDADFDKWINDKLVQEVFISSFFNSSDFINPIYYYLDDIDINMRRGLTIHYDTFFKKNYIELQDGLLGFFSTQKNDYYYQKAKDLYSNSDMGVEKKIIFEQTFKIDREYDIYHRSVYTFADVL